MYNLQKLKDIQSIQGGNYTAHKGLVDDAKPVVEAYNATGLKPVAQNISEADMQKYIAANPGSASLDWQPTGTTHYVDENGITNYQTQWTAYDPKGSVIVPASLIKDWKSSGLLDMHPDLVQNMKKDANGQPMLPYAAFTNLNTENSRLKADAKQKTADDFQTKKDALELQHIAAQTAQERATAAASGDEAALRSFELKQEKSAVAAQAVIAKSGDEAWTLPPNKGGLTPDQKVALQPQIQKDIEGYRTELNDPLLKEQLGSTDSAVVAAAQQRATELHQQLDAARAHSIYVPQGAAKTAPISVTFNGQVGVFPTQDAADAFIKAHPGAAVAGGTSTPGSAYSPTDRVIVRRGDGTTLTTTKAEYDKTLQENPGAKLTIVGKAPATREPSPSQTMAGLNLTATQ
jgi:hypothetical protein